MSKKYLFIILVVLIILIVGFLFYRNWLADLFSSYLKSNIQPANIEIEDISFDEKTEDYEIKVNYPQFKGKESLSDINDLIKEKFQQDVQSFKEDVQGNAIVEVGALSYLQISYETILFEDELLSLRFGTLYYVAGMAHPNSYYSSFNYNLQNNTKIELADLFLSGEDYLKTLSDLSRQILKTQIDPEYYSEYFVDPGTEPILDNFQVFNFTKENLFITFNPYQVGPWALGPQFVEIPFEQLSGFTY